MNFKLVILLPPTGWPKGLAVGGVGRTMNLKLITLLLRSTLCPLRYAL